MCDAILGGNETGLVCTGVGHPHGHTFDSPGGDLRGQEHKDGGGDDD